MGNVFGSIMQGLVSMVFPLICYFTNGSWVVYLLSMAVPMTLAGLYGLLVTVRSNPHSLAQPSVVQHSRKIVLPSHYSRK